MLITWGVCVGGGEGNSDDVRLKTLQYEKWFSALSLNHNGFTLQISEGLTREEEYIPSGFPRQNKGQLVDFSESHISNNMVKNDNYKHVVLKKFGR